MLVSEKTSGTQGRGHDSTCALKSNRLVMVGHIAETMYKYSTGYKLSQLKDLFN